MLSFYEANTKSLRKRGEEVQALALQARANTAARLSEIRNVTALGESESAKDTNIAPARVQTASINPPANLGDVLQRSSDLGRRIDVSIHADLTRLSVETTYGVEAAKLLGAQGGLADFRRIAALPTSSTAQVAPQATLIARQALAVAEAGHYAEMLAAAYRSLQEAVDDTMKAIRESEKSACTCAD